MLLNHYMAKAHWEGRGVSACHPSSLPPAWQWDIHNHSQSKGIGCVLLLMGQVIELSNYNLLRNMQSLVPAAAQAVIKHIRRAEDC